MIRARFNVTYEILSEESAEQGDSDERGFICQSVTLREAAKAVHETRTCHVGGVECIEPDSWPAARVRWITVSNSMEFLTGEYESRSLHIPDTVSASSSRRIARLVGARL